MRSSKAVLLPMQVMGTWIVYKTSCRLALLTLRFSPAELGSAGDQGEFAMALGLQGVPGLTRFGLLVGFCIFHSGASVITALMSLEKKSSMA